MRPDLFTVIQFYGELSLLPFELHWNISCNEVESWQNFLWLMNDKE